MDTEKYYKELEQRGHGEKCDLHYCSEWDGMPVCRCSPEWGCSYTSPQTSNQLENSNSTEVVNMDTHGAIKILPAQTPSAEIVVITIPASGLYEIVGSSVKIYLEAGTQLIRNNPFKQNKECQ